MSVVRRILIELAWIPFYFAYALATTFFPIPTLIATVLYFVAGVLLFWKAK